MENQGRSPEEIQKQPSSDRAQEVQKLLEQGNFVQAETLAKSANLGPEDWERIEMKSDSAIREISLEPLPQEPISAEKAQEVIIGAENEKILQYGETNDPETQNILALSGIVIENDKILAELTDTIEEAKSQVTGNMWAKPVGFLALPVISDVYAIVKGRKLQKSLRRLEKLNSKLKDPKILNSKVDADKISPDKGHMATLAGYATATVGYGVAAAGVVSASPVAAGIGLGAMVVGSVTSLIGYIKQAISFSDMSKTKQTLKGLESRINEAKSANQIARMQTAMYKSSYIAGARENLQPMIN